MLSAVTDALSTWNPTRSMEFLSHSGMLKIKRLVSTVSHGRDMRHSSTNLARSSSAASRVKLAYENESIDVTGRGQAS
jgi:hypothetical protein